MATTTYTFDSGLEGWRGWNPITETYQNSLIQYDSVGDDIFIQDTSSGIESFASPTSMSGDQSDLIGGTFSFDIAINIPSSATITDIPVGIRAADGTQIGVSVDVPDQTGGFLSGRVTVELSHTVFGVTEAEFARIMSDVQHFQISADFLYGDERIDIDNVTFAGPPHVDGEDTGELMNVGYTDDDGDQISNTGSGDTIFGNGGDDTINAGSRSDVIDGGADNDLIDGGFGTDTMDGGAGNDTVSYQNAFGGTERVNLDLDAGTGQLINSSGTVLGTETVTNFENAIGGNSNDTLAGTADANSLEGRDGNDSLDGRGGNDTLDGGIGRDTLIGGDGDDTLIGGVNGSLGDQDSILGGAGNDSIFGAHSEDTIRGGDDNDIIDGGFSTDNMDGGAGNDTVSYEQAFGNNEKVNLDLAAGTGQLFSSAGAFVATETATNFENAIGGAGDDTITGTSGSNQLEGRDGDDSLIGGNGADNDTLIGGAGNDFLDGDLGNVTVDGGADADTVQVADDHGTALITGGETGTDTDEIDFNNFAGSSGANVTFTGDEAGTASFGSANVTFSEIEAFDLTENNDSLNASASSVSVTVDAGGGNDTLTGGAAADTLDGGAGNDLIDGGQGVDSLDGGAGNDTVSFENAIGGDVAWVRYEMNTGEAALNNAAGVTQATETVVNFENAEGSAGNDWFTGDGDDNRFEMGEGNDLAEGGGGDDTLLGGDGNDNLIGGDGSDSLVGGAGNDTLQGSADFSGEVDTLIGGDGNDLFDAGPGDASMDGGGDADLIQVYSDQGSMTITGGETGNDADTLVLNEYAVVSGANVNLTGDEAGNGTFGTASVDFTEIEDLVATIRDDTVTAISDAEISVDGNTGTDTLSISDVLLPTDVQGLASAVGTFTPTLGSAVSFGGVGQPTLQQILDGVYDPGSGPLAPDGNYVITGDSDGSDSDVDGQIGDVTFDNFELVNFTVRSPGPVDGAATGEDMQVGYTDGNGDEITNAADTIFGNAGNDTINAGDGDDSVEGGDDNDVIDGGVGNDTLIGGLGNDSILGGPTAGTTGIDGADSLDGGQGNDTLDGGEGNDTIDGGEGDDVLVAGFGSDTFIGGTGQDTVEMAGSAVESDFQFDISVDNTGDGSDTFGNTYDSVEHFVASENNDVPLPPPFGGVVPGNDTITLTDAVQADAVLNLDTAVGTFTPVVGSAIAFGGVGQPSLQNILDGQLPDGTGVNPGGTYQVTSGDESGQVGNISFENFETINFTVTDNAVDGEATGEVMGVGYDDATGATNGGGNLITNSADTIYGNGGDDTISAGDGDDVVDGGTGADVLTGGAGNDQLTGGLGNDTYVFADGSGADTIIGFDTVDDNSDGFTNDQIDVSSLTDADGNPVDLHDVTVSDDGSGNALLTFPNGETILLQGVAPSAVQTGAQLYSVGIPCFTSGTLIATPRGEVPVESLRPGNLVHTMDNGAQPVLWVGRRALETADLQANPAQRPVLIPEGLMNNHSPLLVSPLHGMLITAEHGGTGEHFARARHLAEARGPVRIAHGKRKVEYIHLLLPSHEVIFANGAPSESFYPGPEALRLYPMQEKQRLFDLIPGLSDQTVREVYGPTARPFMRRKDVLNDLDLCAALRAEQDDWDAVA